jgi:hypothetical protein
MAGLVKMPGRMLARRAVATTDVAAGQTPAQMHPAHAGFQTFFTTARQWWHRFHVDFVRTQHADSPSTLRWKVDSTLIPYISRAELRLNLAHRRQRNNMIEHHGLGSKTASSSSACGRQQGCGQHGWMSPSLTICRSALSLKRRAVSPSWHTPRRSPFSGLDR